MVQHARYAGEIRHDAEAIYSFVSKNVILKKKVTLSKILCKWKQNSVISFFLYLDSIFKNKHKLKLVHN